MATHWMQIAIVTIVSTIGAPVPGIAQSSQPKSDTYTPQPVPHDSHKVPEGGLAAIKTVKPGEWVTVTSRDQPSTEDDAVVSVRPYIVGRRNGGCPGTIVPARSESPSQTQ